MTLARVCEGCGRLQLLLTWRSLLLAEFSSLSRSVHDLRIAIVAYLLPRVHFRSILGRRRVCVLLLVVVVSKSVTCTTLRWSSVSIVLLDCAILDSWVCLRGFYDDLFDSTRACIREGLVQISRFEFHGLVPGERGSTI